MSGHTVVIHTGFGVLLAAVALPLVLRRVPMNHFYGVRVAAAFNSDALWYDINAYGGRLLFVYGVLVALLGVLAQDFAPARTSPWFLPFAIGPLVLALGLIPPILTYARRRAEQEP